MLRASPFVRPLRSPPDLVTFRSALACGVQGGISTAPCALFGSSFGLDPLEGEKKSQIPFCFGILVSPADLVGVGSVPDCGVHKDEHGLKGATWVDLITEPTSVSLVGGLEVQGSGLLFSPVDLMNFGSMPGCGVNKDKTTFTGATGDDFA